MQTTFIASMPKILRRVPLMSRVPLVHHPWSISSVSMEWNFREELPAQQSSSTLVQSCEVSLQYSSRVASENDANHNQIIQVSVLYLMVPSTNFKYPCSMNMKARRSSQEEINKKERKKKDSAPERLLPKRSERLALQSPSPPEPSPAHAILFFPFRMRPCHPCPRAVLLPSPVLGSGSNGSTDGRGEELQRAADR
ncbi:hypothetical protein TNCV_5136381 [Trichonephila clavipes]|nr:hypothetical protein TNCV_5136381 [Trichonephila clavipes]